MNTLDIVNDYFSLLEGKSNKNLHDMVSDDITFEGPFFKANGKEAFVNGMHQWIQLPKTYAMKKQITEGNETCSLYDVTVTSPKGITLTIPMSDWITIENGKIIQEQVFFDPTEWAKAMGK